MRKVEAMKEELISYLYELTKGFPECGLESFSANQIAESLGLSRSTISSYLNQGCREGTLVKVRQYPVLFFHKQSLVEQGYAIASTDFDSLEALSQTKTSKKNKSTLEEVIGAHGSLKEAIDQIKTATLYPQGGLPILLLGASGSGKTFLASKIHEFSVEQKLIASDAPFIAYNCAQYFSNPELLSSVLFGYTKGAFTGADEDRPGLIEKADGGILFLDEVHRLSEEGQEKLFTFMDTGLFSPMGDNSIQKSAAVRLVFATTENIYSAFLPTFLRRLPVIINLPKFQKRSQSERLQLVDSFFVRESGILKKELHVSERLTDFLLSADLEGNVGKIKNIVKYACANAYVHQQEEDAVKVRLLDLPREFTARFKEQVRPGRKAQADRVYLPNTVKQPQLQSREVNHLERFFKDLEKDFGEFSNHQLQTKDFLNKSSQSVTLLMDELMFRESYEKDENLYSLLTYNLRQIFENLHDSYGFPQDGNLVVALANYLYIKGSKEVTLTDALWPAKRRKLLDFLGEALEVPYWYAKKLLSKLAQQLDQEVYDDDLILVTFYFYSLELSSVTNEIKGLVLAHGYSTASSLANVANRMLKKNVFSAYDMPLDISLDKIETHLIHYLDDNRTDAGLILLVDMGSLNQLGERLEKRLRGPLMIIDHVSTPLVLEIGQQILNGKSIGEIDKGIESELHIRKQLIYPQKEKKKAILTCCYTGIGSATQIQEILQKCLEERAADCVILPYDYKKLAQNKTYEMPFQLYDVLMIVGTEDPQIANVPYIGLDQLVNGERIGQFIELLQDYFPIEEKDIEDELIFNFSINKIVENLTILDATKLLRLVQTAVGQTEELLGESFTNNQLFLLYLHCSCMVERILRKESVDEQADLAEYKQKYSHRLDLIHHGFKDLESEYTITIPDLELRLINDIIGE